MGKFIDLQGQRFGRLLVIKRFYNNDKHNKPFWVCQCDCGNECIIAGQSLRDGKTLSCGCYNREVAAITGVKLFTKHGDTSTHEYKVWISMRRRIKEPNKETYKRITICDYWNNSYEAFLRDMGRAPSKEYQIDRIDNNKGYFPGNCRWVTRSENCRNKSDNVLIEWNGETKCLYEWAEIICPKLNITPDSLQYRIKSGWTVEKAFTTPKRRNQFH